MNSLCNLRKPISTKIELSMGLTNNILINIFIFNVIVFPNDTFNIKILSLLALLVINFPSILNARQKHERVIVFFGLILTSLAILWSIVLTKQFSNVRFGYPGYILLLYFTIKKYKINFTDAFIFYLKLFALFISIMALADILRVVDMYDNDVLMWFADTSNAMIGKGEELPIKIMIFMKTSPLFFVGLFFCLQKKQWFSCLLFSFVIVLSGTRANILMLLLSLLVYFCILFPYKKVIPLIHGVLLLFAVLILFDGRVINFFTDMFQRKASSDAVRDGHLQSIFDLWKAKPSALIFGSGYSARFFSYGVMEATSNIELSYWNLLRQVGLILFIPMMAMYLYPIYISFKSRKNAFAVCGYLFYLVIAYTNPFLYSSTGVILLLYMYVLSFNNEKTGGKR